MHDLKGIERKDGEYQNSCVDLKKDVHRFQAFFE